MPLLPNISQSARVAFSRSPHRACPGGRHRPGPLWATRGCVLLLHAVAGPRRGRRARPHGPRGGLVRPGSVPKCSADAVQLPRSKTRARSVSVLSKGDLPDLFREGQGVVAQDGSTSDGGCSSPHRCWPSTTKTYMPAELKRGLDAARPRRPRSSRPRGDRRTRAPSASRRPWLCLWLQTLGAAWGCTRGSCPEGAGSRGRYGAFAATAGSFAA
jgi:cytochrome c-type biogenesis protein CcmE